MSPSNVPPNAPQGQPLPADARMEQWAKIAKEVAATGNMVKEIYTALDRQLQARQPNMGLLRTEDVRVRRIAITNLNMTPEQVRAIEPRSLEETWQFVQMVLQALSIPPASIAVTPAARQRTVAEEPKAPSVLSQTEEASGSLTDTPPAVAQSASVETAPREAKSLPRVVKEFFRTVMNGTTVFKEFVDNPQNNTDDLQAFLEKYLVTQEAEILLDYIIQYKKIRGRRFSDESVESVNQSMEDLKNKIRNNSNAIRIFNKLMKAITRDIKVPAMTAIYSADFLDKFSKIVDPTGTLTTNTLKMGADYVKGLKGNDPVPPQPPLPAE